MSVYESRRTYKALAMYPPAGLLRMAVATLCDPALDETAVAGCGHASLLSAGVS